MTHLRNAQQWVLLGTSPASEEVWGLREINFPCGYMMPPGAFAKQGEPLERPYKGEVWVMGGVALELAKGGKVISASEAEKHVAGYRPWVCLFHHALLDELTERGHTIEMWDRGVSIFHGLWRQNSQLLFDHIPKSDFDEIMNTPVTIGFDGSETQGSAPVDYAHDAKSIVHFMSQFMTLSEGDIWVQGPLVAKRLPIDVNLVSMRIGSHVYSVDVD